MDSGWARHRFAAAQVARLATVDSQRRPHVVPMVFAVVGEVIYSAVDGKPKTGVRLARLNNIAVNPAVSALVDCYSDDWRELWWARADGTARVIGVGADEATVALTELARRYAHYREQPPPGPIVAVDVARWSGWAAQ
jgi:PPOX class probable F420-dependent enzyme